MIVRTAVSVAALGSGLLGGLYLTFSTAVMPVLARRPPAEATAVMQAFNTVIPGPLFGLVYALTTLACLIVVASPLVSGGPGAVWRIAGGLAGLAGMVTTGVVSIPLNTRIDREGVAVWAEFLAAWTPWNDVRAVTSVIATVLLLVALRRA